MVKSVIDETFVIEVANCEENKWRRDNLLKATHVKDIGNYFQVMFSFVVNYGDNMVNTKLIYNIRK